MKITFLLSLSSPNGRCNRVSKELLLRQQQLNVGENDRMMILGNRRNKRTLAGTLEDSLILCGIVAHFKRAGDNRTPVALRLLWVGSGSQMIAIVTHPLFWRMKWKIGILTLAVFAAMC